MDFISNVCGACDLLPREIEGFFRIFSQFMAVAESDEIGKTEWIKASSLLIGISINNFDFYHKIGQGKVTPKEVEKYIKGLSYSGFGHDNPERYFLFIAMSFLLRNTRDGEEEKEIARICLEYDGEIHTDETEEAAINQVLQSLRRSIDDFMRGTERSTFQRLYSMIEDWRSFIE